MLSPSDLRAIQNVIEVSQKPIKEEPKSLRGDLATFKDEILHEVVAMRQELSLVRRNLLWRKSKIFPSRPFKDTFTRKRLESN